MQHLADPFGLVAGEGVGAVSGFDLLLDVWGVDVGARVPARVTARTGSVVIPVPPPSAISVGRLGKGARFPISSSAKQQWWVEACSG